MSCQIYSIPDELFIQLIHDSSSIKEVCEKLGYTNVGGGVNQLFKQRCEELEIDWQHSFNSTRKTPRKLTFEQVFCKDSSVTQTTLREWYKKGEYSDYCCAICGISEWHEQPLSLRLDHIDGNNHNNVLSNLRWLCPNCDSQQETYCGRNIKQKIPQKFCVDCGKPITSDSTKNVKRCLECSAKHQRKVKDRPSKEVLFNQLCESSFVAVGRLYNVSDNAIRKWCRMYGLSDKASDYKSDKRMGS